MSNINSGDTMPAVFQNRAEKFGSNACVAYKKESTYTDISWTEMNKMVRSLGLYLLSQGIKKGDAVAIFSPNRYEWWVADLAILSIGGINVPIYATNSADEAYFILENSESKICFVGEKAHLHKILRIKHRLRNLKTVVVFNETGIRQEDVLSFRDAMAIGDTRGRPEDFNTALASVRPEDMATYIYTSGTTGNPKGVMLTHHNILSNVRQGLEDFKDLVTPEDTFFSFLPLSHALERTVGFYLPIHQGSKVAFVQDVSKTLLDNLKEIRPTLMISVPRIYERIHAGILSKVNQASPIKKRLFNWSMKIAAKNIPYVCKNIPRKGLFAIKYNLADKLVLSKLKHAIGLDRLKYAISGGGPLSVSDCEFFIGMGLKIYEGFGLTETSPVTNVNKPVLIKIGTVGPALKDTTVKISNEGEILIKGPQVMKGYYKDEAATKEVFDENGFFKTGDIGIIDEDGYLKITGRIKDIIITAGGKNISPQNIEGDLKTSLFIEQVAITGDRRKYLSALIVPAFEELERWARNSNIDFNSRGDLINNKKVQDLIAGEIETHTKHYSRVEQIKKFRLMENEWSQDSGELTPSLKVKRRIIEQKYGHIIEGLYNEEGDKQV